MSRGLKNGERAGEIGKTSLGRGRGQGNHKAECLEIKPQRELNDSRIVLLSAQILQTGGHIETILAWTVVIGMVEHVEEISRKPCVHTLFNLEVLEERKIHIPGSRSLVKRPGIGINDVR